MKLVPVMSLIYIGSSVVVLVMNVDKIGSVFFSILRSAFNFRSFFGGFIPMFIVGVQRGIFSNEAGIGTSSIVCSSSDRDDYKTLGYTQMFGVYVTTFIICTATAIIILFSDYGSLVLSDINGIELASYAFNYHFGSIGTYILLISIILFSFSTIITGYYYGESSFNYFFSKLDDKYIFVLRIITVVILFLGCIISSRVLWDIVDILIGIVVLINLYAIWKLKDDV
jgi:AGCS family alanine or glycine:cation symporter